MGTYSLAAGANHKRGRNPPCGERAKLSSPVKMTASLSLEKVSGNHRGLCSHPLTRHHHYHHHHYVVTTLVAPTHSYSPSCSFQRTSNTAVPLSMILLSTGSLPRGQLQSSSRERVRRSLMLHPHAYIPHLASSRLAGISLSHMITRRSGSARRGGYRMVRYLERPHSHPFYDGILLHHSFLLLVIVVHL